MAVIIGTASKIANKFGAGIHGFDAGDEQVGRDATELSDDWCDGVQQEINNCIAKGPNPLDNTNRSQLAYSVEYQTQVRYPRHGGNIIYTWRSQGDTLQLGNSATYLRREKTDFKYNVAANTTQNLVGLTIPSNSQANLLLRGSIVGTDTITNYGNTIQYASVRNSGGVYTVQSSSALLSDIPLAGLIITVVTTLNAFYLRFAIPAAPAGKVYNIFATGSIENVTQ